MNKRGLWNAWGPLQRSNVAEKTEEEVWRAIGDGELGTFVGTLGSYNVYSLHRPLKAGDEDWGRRVLSDHGFDPVTLDPSL